VYDSSNTQIIDIAVWRVRNLLRILGGSLFEFCTEEAAFLIGRFSVGSSSRAGKCWSEKQRVSLQISYHR
jgi:hypothetical protein